jgi:hypothetical protein
MMSERTEPMDKSVVKQIAAFNFGEIEEFSTQLDARTDISTKDMFKAMAYCRGVGKFFHCTEADDVANFFARLLISSDRMGRTEAVTSLLQKLPRVEKQFEGSETMITPPSTEE